MATSVVHKVRRAVLLHDGAGLTDGRLLGLFIDHRDDAAFAALIRRHGPMVWGVCRRLLGPHDAEDAFQATFLVLVRKAAAVVPRERVGNWLYGVARQTALQARRTAVRRKGREQQVAQMPEPAAPQDARWCDLRPLLDQELGRLPDQYRAVVVLCDLEGQTRKETARQLGVPEGSVSGWLARGRAMLAKRLTRRGVTLSAGALTAVLTEAAGSACVPASATDSTINVAALVAAGQAAAGTVSPTAAALTEGVVKAMLLSRLKLSGAVFLALAVIGGAGLTYVYSPQPAQATTKDAPAGGNGKPAGKRIPTDKDRLQGTWQVAEVAMRGRELEKVPEDQGKRQRAVFKGDQLDWRGFKLTYTLDPSKKPKQMDWSLAEGEGKGEKVLAIYELTGDTLKVCMANPGEDRPTEFKSVAGGPGPEGKVKVLVFKRVKADKTDEKKAPPAGRTSAAGNVLRNGGFEEGDRTPAHWSRGAEIEGVEYVWDRKTGRKGTASVCLRKTANRYFPIAQWHQTVERAGDRPALRVAAQVKAEGVTKAIIDVAFLDGKGEVIGHKWAAYIGAKKAGDPAVSHDWKEYSGRVEIQPGTRKLLIGLQIYGPGKVWFDEVRAEYER